MKTNNAIAERLIAERKKRNLSQKDMRMLIGMSQQQYQRVEAGQDLKVSTLLRILAGLDLELAIVESGLTVKHSDADSMAEQESLWTNRHKHLED
ncbi:helix-turn-helix domain-containing protein [Bowmanella denitrificans]|uniref:helix-turn-helix domain-containing protein n=1 Tax=Bowmanella denitrificans TaxID=366582 RepID=UPI000C9D1513|nr:helix-turn-helix transcriptional regulator [Bowmanella denitrificans]